MYQDMYIIIFIFKIVSCEMYGVNKFLLLLFFMFLFLDYYVFIIFFLDRQKSIVVFIIMLFLFNFFSFVVVKKIKTEEQDELKKKLREDWRKQKEFEEMRKVGIALVMIDEEGK